MNNDHLWDDCFLGFLVVFSGREKLIVTVPLRVGNVRRAMDQKDIAILVIYMAA